MPEEEMGNSSVVNKVGLITGKRLALQGLRKFSKSK
jgi:hypothetical protein